LPVNKPKLLFLAQVLPYPPDGGVAIRTFNVLRLLAREFDLRMLCFFRRALVRDVANSVEGLRQFGDVNGYDIPEEFSAVKKAMNHFRSVVSGRPYTVFAYENREFRRQLRQELSRGIYDLVHFDSLDLSSYFDEVKGLPTVCVHHNVESALLRRRSDTEPRGITRRYLRHQADLMEGEERRWIGRVSLNVAVSDADASQLRAMSSEARVEVVPNGVDVEAFVPAQAGPRSGIVFVGGMSWFPNRDALEYFAGDILPQIHGGKPDVNVTWVGRALPESMERYRMSGITLTGYVDDIRPYVNSAAVYVVPIRVGGGTRLKILDAWALGKAVVSTSVGCEGLRAEDGVNILIRDDPREFAAAVIAVLQDEVLRERLGRNARQTAEKTYSWGIVGSSMISSYRSILR